MPRPKRKTPGWQKAFAKHTEEVRDFAAERLAEGLERAKPTLRKGIHQFIDGMLGIEETGPKRPQLQEGRTIDMEKCPECGKFVSKALLPKHYRRRHGGA